MPKIPSIVILALAAMTASVVAAHYEVYLLGGQSNGNGRADAAQLTSPLDAAQTDVRFYWNRTQSVTNVGHLLENQWIDLAPGSGHGGAAPVYAKEFGCEVSFGRAMADANSTANIAIIKYALGGSNLYNQWSASGAQYATFISTVQTALAALTAAGHTYELSGMLWVQGESDTSGSNADNYEANLTSLITRVRTDLAPGSGFSFMLSSLSNSQYSNITTPGTDPYKVRQAQEAVAAADPTVGIVITDGYSTRPTDTIHFDHTAMIALGQSFAAQIQLLPQADSDAVTTGVFDENVDATNAIETENPASTLATFKTDVQTAFDNNLGGVVDWESGVTTTPSTGSANNTLTAVDVDYGVSASKLLTITFDRSMELWTNNINGQVSVLSRQGSSQNAIVPGGTSASSVLFTMTFSGANVTELGAAMPSRSTYGALGVNFDVTANFSGGGNAVLSDTIGGTIGTDDTFFHFTAPSGERITSLSIAYADDNGQGLTDGQRRPILDDFGFIAEDAVPLPDVDVLTTGVFDENVDATNAIDVEFPSSSLTAFKAAVQSAFDSNTGGVIDWETGVTTVPSAASAANNELPLATTVGFGTSPANVLTITFDQAMLLYTNNINNQVSVLSQQGSSQNALIPKDGNDVDYTMTFAGAEVIELGAAIPSRSTYAALGVDFRATVTYSGSGSTDLDFNVGGMTGTSDVFLRFVAPAGEAITSFAVAYLDDNGQGLSNGQRRPILDDIGFITGVIPEALTTGIFDENVDATNAIDVEITPSSLAPFKAAVQTAFDNDLGGVIDWETGIATVPSSGGIANNTIPTVFDIGYGTSASELLTITLDEAMLLYTNNINGQVSVLSQQGSFQNALITTDANDVEYTMTFSGAEVIELGAAIPSRSTYAALGVDFRAAAVFSGSGSTAIDFNVGGTVGTGDAFLHFVAPSGESITSFSVVFLDDNGQGLSNGQRRPILDDLGFIVASPADTFASWIGNPAFGLDPAQQGFNDDPDDDNLDSGLESWFSTNPGEFTQGLTELATDGTTTTFIHPQNTSPVSDVSGSYQWSPNLVDWYAGDDVEGPPGGPTVIITSATAAGTTIVTAVVSEEIPKLFVRAVVVQD